MELRRIRALRGPNVWARVPVLEARVELGEWDRPSDQFPGFAERLLGSLPSLAEHRGGFVEELQRGTDLGTVLVQLTLELQTQAGTPVGFGQSAGAERGVRSVAVAYEYEALGRACLEVARQFCLAALDDRPFDGTAEIRRLRALEFQLRPGPGTRAIIRAARARGIPVLQLSPPPGNLLQLGYGAKQRRASNARTDCTGSIAQAISQDKELTRTLLVEAGILVPEGRPVADAEDAWEAARQLGLPVVVKPQDQDNGRGVALHLTTRQQVYAAYEAARRESPNVLVERQAPGWHHRLLVIGGRLVAAARHDPAQVVGDGAHPIGQLVAEANADPRRGPDGPLCEICVDETARQVLAGQGYTLESVPPAGARVLIHRHSYLQDGGTLADVTDQVHPEVAAQVIEAARVIGLDLAGIDVVAQDLARPLEEQGGVVLEVNDTPALGQHLPPLSDPSRPVGEAIVDLLFPRPQTGRIPVVAVAGGRRAGSVSDRRPVTRLVTHILRGTGWRVGMASADGLYLDGRRVRAGDGTGLRGAWAVLRNPTMEAAVLETSWGAILREGLGFDHCDVAVVTDTGEGDHLGPQALEAPTGLAGARRVLVEAVAPQGAAVLKADDPLVETLAAHCPGSVVLFARDPDHPVLAAHREASGRAVFARHDELVLAEGPREVVLVRLVGVPLGVSATGGRGGHTSSELENALAAVAATWVLGCPLQAIRAGLETFAADIVPGRAM